MDEFSSIGYHNNNIISCNELSLPPNGSSAANHEYRIRDISFGRVGFTLITPWAPLSPSMPRVVLRACASVCINHKRYCYQNDMVVLSSTVSSRVPWRAKKRRQITTRVVCWFKWLNSPSHTFYFCRSKTFASRRAECVFLFENNKLISNINPRVECCVLCVETRRRR